MKKLVLLFVIILMAINFAAAATEYVLIKEGEKITIYNLSSDLNRTWITSFSLMNPTISQLKYSDLPEDLWKLTNAKDGIYDTRLQKMIQKNQELEEENTYLKADAKDIEESNQWNKIKLVLSLIAIVVLIIGVIAQKIDLKELKKQR